MKIGSLDLENPLELMQCIIAFDSRDWWKDDRDRMLYAVAFGWDSESLREKGWSKETIKAYEIMHERYEALKSEKFDSTNDYQTGFSEGCKHLEEEKRDSYCDGYGSGCVEEYRRIEQAIYDLCESKNRSVSYLEIMNAIER